MSEDNSLQIGKWMQPHTGGLSQPSGRSRYCGLKGRHAGKG
jgi:hypothetical protein